MEEADSYRQQPAGQELSFEERLKAIHQPQPVSRENWPIVDQPAYSAALERANTASTYLETEAVEIANAFSRDAWRTNAFSKLSRYETTIERALFKALNELHALQRERQDETAGRTSDGPELPGIATI